MRWLMDQNSGLWRLSDAITDHPLFRWGPIALCGVMALVAAHFGNYEHATLVASVGAVGWYVTRGTRDS